MNLMKVPGLLFNEFSEKMGQGKEREISTPISKITIRELDPELCGSKGAIGFKKTPTMDGIHFILLLWESVPKRNQHREPVIRIVAYPRSTGTWAHGRGCKMQETCKLYAPAFKGIDLKKPVSRVASKIMKRAHELAIKAEAEEFWERERNPNATYDESPFY